MKRYFLPAVLFGFLSCAAFAQIPQSDGYGYSTPSRPAGSSANYNNSGEGVPMPAKIAGLSEDMKSNQKDIQELSLRVEQLERDKAALENKISAGGNYATKDDLKLTEARITAATNSAIAAESKRVEAEILDQIKAAKKSVVKAEKVDAGVIPVAKTAATLPAKASAAATTGKIPVSDGEKASYMKEGIRYTVQPGDSLTSIAKHYHSSVRAIMVANDISSPNKLWVGKELFVPSLEK